MSLVNLDGSNFPSCTVLLQTSGQAGRQAGRQAARKCSTHLLATPAAVARPLPLLPSQLLLLQRCHLSPMRLR